MHGISICLIYSTGGELGGQYTLWGFSVKPFTVSLLRTNPHCLPYEDIQLQVAFPPERLRPLKSCFPAQLLWSYHCTCLGICFNKYNLRVYRTAPKLAQSSCDCAQLFQKAASYRTILEFPRKWHDVGMVLWHFSLPTHVFLLLFPEFHKLHCC